MVDSSRLESPTQESVSEDEGSVEPGTEKRSEEENSQEGEEPDEEGEEGEGECGFCLFMKSGTCKENFVKWEDCVEEAENAKEDIVSKCYQVTVLLKECMEKNMDYYEPVLRAEREMNEQAISLDQGNGTDSTGNEAQQGKSEDQIQKEDVSSLHSGQQEDQDRPRKEESPAQQVEVRNLSGTGELQFEH